MGRGGVEIQLRDRAAELTARGHSVAVVSMMPFLDFESWLRDAGVRTLSLQLGKGWSVPGAAVRYLRFLRQFRPDAVHAHLFVAVIFARAFRLLPRTVRGDWRVLVCSSHSNQEVKPFRYRAYRWTNSLGDAWTSVTRAGIAVHERAGALPAGTALWTPNGISLEDYTSADRSTRAQIRAELALHGRFTWLALGSFRDESKDYTTLLKAFARNAGQSLLLIGGEGRLLPEKQALAVSLGIADRVRFLGLRKDTVRLLQAADAYVLSSQNEAMPNVLLQAASCELPVVSTDVGEAAAIIEDGVGGLVVPPRNVEALSRALSVIETMTVGDRQAMGRAGRARVADRFDMRRVVDRWEELYRDLLVPRRC